MGAVVACATCGTQLRENARFCDGCGSAIEASPRVPGLWATDLGFEGHMKWAEAMT